MAWPRVCDVLLRKRQRLARGHADLRLDQVDAGHHLGDRVLDLDPGVHLDEVEVVVLVDDELDRRRRWCSWPASTSRRAASHIAARVSAETLVRGSPRSASDGVAGRSSRVPTGGPRCRGGRRGPAPRRAGGSRCTSRGRRRRCRRPPRPRPGPAGATTSAPGRSTRPAFPCRRRPPTALISTGNPICVGELEGFLLAGDQPVAAGHDRHVGVREPFPGRRSCRPAWPSPRARGR